MSHSRTPDDPPEGGWIAPGPGKAQTAEEFMDGVGDQTREEYEAEIAAHGQEAGGKSRSWRGAFSRQISKLKREQKETGDGR